MPNPLHVASPGETHNCGQEHAASLTATERAPAAEDLPSGLLTDPLRVLELTGLVPDHLPILQSVAEKTGYIIAFRPVDKFATQLIEEGYPTKNFHIKGKSSSWGPMAGFIPVNQAFSKLEGQSDRVDKSNRLVQSCLTEGHANSGPLVISKTRLIGLKNLGVIDLSLPSTTGIINITARGQSGQDYLFTAVPNNRGSYAVQHQGKPVMVLCQPSSSKPLTADYDLMLVAPPLAQYGQPDRLSLPDISHQVFRQRMNNYRNIPSNVGLLNDWINPQTFYQRAHQYLGNVSPRMTELIPHLNAALGCLPGRELVHHGIDAANPTTDPPSNYPVTLFLPHALAGLPRMLLATDSQSLRHVVLAAKDVGFHVPLNPLWEENLGAIRRTSFTDALAALQRRP